MKKFWATLLLSLIFLTISARKVAAYKPSTGIHLLDPNELSQAVDLVAGTKNEPGSVTVVLRSDDHHLTKWQKFFDLAAEKNITPIVRLATNMVSGGWRVPEKKDIVDHARFLSFLNWHTNNLYVIAFNEPNHAAEWGGRIDPEGYAEMLEFTLNWFHTERKNFNVLSAGLDAAAPNGGTTMDSLAFLERMLAHRPEIIHRLNGWTAHAYPNPSFSGSPQDQSKMSVVSWRHELDFLSKYTGREFDVFITETGWSSSGRNADQIAANYRYALENVWNDSRIKVVTPFVLAAHQGPFQQFSFLNQDGSPTPQYLSWREFRPEDTSHFSYLLGH